MKKKIIVTVLALAAAAVLMAIGIATGPDGSLSGEQYADVTEYFGNITKGQYAVVLEDGELAEDHAISIDGQEGYFFPWKDAASFFDSPVYVDEANKKGMLARPDEIWYFTPGESGYETEDGEFTDTDYTVVVEQDGTYYVNLLYLPEVMDIHLDTDNAETSSIVVITDDKMQVAEAAKSSDEGGIRVFTEASKKKPIYTRKNEVYILESDDDWSKVMTTEGYVGYAYNRELGVNEDITLSDGEPEYTNLTSDETICLGWHQIASEGGNDTLRERLSVADGMNVISPTWFYVANEDGDISSYASEDYVTRAHRAGLKVWGLVDNFSVSIDSGKFMGNTKARHNMISQLISEAKKCGLDGINLDFESIKEEDAVSYTELVRELSISCRKNELVFSIDDPVPTYSSYYNRDVQGTVADYVIIMGYDETYSGSEEAGSNASLSFVKQGIKDTLKEVPASKVISAMPFYTRLWIESYSNGSLECQTLGMVDANAYVEEKGMVTYWDADAGQNIAELDTEDNLQKMWMEDEESLEKKLKLISKYKLAGGAFWRLGFENEEIWDVINEYLSDDSE